MKALKKIKYIAPEISLFLYQLPDIILANDAPTTAAEGINDAYSIIWEFIMFIIATVVLMGVAFFIRAFLALARNSDNPSVRQRLYSMIFREFWILAAAGGFGVIFSTVIAFFS